MSCNHHAHSLSLPVSTRISLANGVVETIDSREIAPAAATEDMFVGKSYASQKGLFSSLSLPSPISPLLSHFLCATDIILQRGIEHSRTRGTSWVGICVEEIRQPSLGGAVSASYPTGEWIYCRSVHG